MTVLTDLRSWPTTTAAGAAAAAAPTTKRPLARQLAWIVALTGLLDALVVTATVTVGWEYRSLLNGLFTPRARSHDLPIVAVFAAVWLAALVWRGAYRPRNVGAGFDEFRAVLLGSGTALAVMTTGAFFTDLPVSRRFILLSALLGTLALLVERYAVRKVIHAARRRGHLRNRVLAVSTPLGLSELTATLRRSEHTGLSVVGTVLPDPHAERELDLPVPLYGGTDDILRACRDAGAETVIVAGGSVPSSVLRRIGWALEGQNIDLVVVPSLIDVAGPRIHMRHVSGLPLVHVEEPQTGRAGGFGKRLFDIVVTSLILVVAAPVLLAVALAVWLDDRGPVFFRQERSGLNGRPFRMTKFRSMVVDADRRLDELIDFNDADDVLFKMKHDPRVTRVGRFLRRYSLDELPQLLDVLRGDMSLVGPRPPLAREVEQYPADMHRRLLVRPGVTGLWQVSGRSDLSFDEAVRMDLYYVDNWSITADLIIMLKTARAVVSSAGAY